MQDESGTKKSETGDVSRELENIKHALSASTIVAITDEQGVITNVNDHFCRISKYSRDELVGKDHRILNSGKHSKKFFRDLWQTIKSGEIWKGDICNRAKNGELYWVSTTIVPFLNGDGKPVKYIAIRHDITKQKEIETSFRDQSELMAQTYDAIFVWSLDDGVSYWNSASENLYGYEFEEIKGKKVYDILKAKYPVPFEDYFEQLRVQGYWHGEITQTTKTGEKLIVESRQVVKHHDPDNPLVLETSRDLTAQKEADERILQQASLLEKTRDAILVCDLNHKIIFWNNGAERAYGYSATEILGKDVCDTICNGDRTVIEEAIAAMLHTDEWQKETINFTKNGGEINVITRWTLVRNELDHPDYFLIVNTDITNLKSAERQLLRAQRMESIGTMAGGIAHDLNNVLSPILMSVEMLQNEFDLPSESQPWLEMIRENTERGADLIKQVLTFARGVGDGIRTEVDLHALVDELTGIMRKTFPRNIKISTALSPGLPAILGDSTQLNQVLLNLCVNAKDAMENGGVIEIKCDHLVIQRPREITPPGQYVRISVSDNGTGMSTGTVSRIWDPFFTTKEVGKGTGLGLSTALSIVEAHNGFIEVSSTPDKGSTFEVYIPVSPGSIIEEPKVAEIESEEGGGELILVVDDEENIRKVTEAALKKNGYSVLTAADGTEALAVFTRNPEIALVLTDMAMPYLDGSSMIRALRNLDSNVRVITMSGLSDSEGKLATISEFHLHKPFTSETLMAQISEVLKT
ncbi:MAG: PAS domain S-box protein [Pyrinomonadaceae bacterium]|nr:PAS domain S-box protein [Pyrinomonadaceae bacterium]